MPGTRKLLHREHGPLYTEINISCIALARASFRREQEPDTPLAGGVNSSPDNGIERTDIGGHQASASNVAEHEHSTFSGHQPQMPPNAIEDDFSTCSNAKRGGSRTVERCATVHSPRPTPRPSILTLPALPFILPMSSRRQHSRYYKVFTHDSTGQCANARRHPLTTPVGDTSRARAH